MSIKKPFTLPERFLEGPAPAIKVSKIDFAKSTIPEYDNLWAVILDDVMTPAECKALVNAAEATTDGKWERAMINVGNGRQALYEDTRNCGRIIWDDKEIVAKLWARVEATVPELQYLENWPKVTGIGPQKRKETWRMTRLNERMRFLKYSSGEFFRPHCDGTYETPDFKERSYFTLHLYLNDASSDPKGQSLQGGSTTFHAFDMKRRIDVEPKIGRVLLFQHKFLLHSGDDVTRGTKLTMRTDVMFEKDRST
ncbi:hypothetical protein BU16DRAFT_464565 [Lophium mytilinum]|uniref:Prolyl 4-hydroxylase alpha subunit domain-containing protein n=1 Tax=Lophium mytilinum TaxID=390894 RepID=A0A6A6QPE2_9PEZI|nr:hypothetical protein BU16DRAFT_464565 [Lophium mytilinum]